MSVDTVASVGLVSGNTGLGSFQRSSSWAVIDLNARAGRDLSFSPPPALVRFVATYRMALVPVVGGFLSTYTIVIAISQRHALPRNVISVPPCRLPTSILLLLTFVLWERRVTLARQSRTFHLALDLHRRKGGRRQQNHRGLHLPSIFS